MKNKIILFIVCLCLTQFALSQTEPTDTDADGSRNISTLDHLLWIDLNSSSWSDDFELDNDIDASDTQNWNSGEGWIPLGNNSQNFYGNFFGQGYKISGLFIDRPLQNYVGFFGYAHNVEIQSLALENCDIIGHDYVGAIIGNNDNISTITNCYSTGSVAGYLSVGGLIGENDYRSNVSNCFSTASVNGSGNAGGLVGYNKSSSIINNCYATGTVVGEDINGLVSSSIGGLVGNNYSSAKISNSYSTGSVSGFIYVGGLVGNNHTSTVSNSFSTGNVIGTRYSGGFIGQNYSSTIEKCYSTGNVTARDGADFIGGFVGFNYYSSTIINSFSRGNVIPVDNGTYFGGLVGANSLNSNITNCYSTGSVSGTSYVGGMLGWNNATVNNSFWDVQTSGMSTSAGGISRFTAEMKLDTTYKNHNWDFNDIWQIDPMKNNGYPSFITVSSTTFEIPLSIGWNMISSYVVPEETNMDSVFKEIKDDILIVKNGKGKLFVPAYDINTIEDWNVVDGYQVYATVSTTLEIKGEAVEPENTPIVLTSGWNMISYLRSNEMSSPLALASITDNNNMLIAKNGFGKLYVPLYNINTIVNFKSGDGYQIYVIQADTLIYPAE